MPSNNPLDYLYEEDVTGSNPANKVENEMHLVTPAIEVGDFNIIVPSMMPYYRNTMRIRHVSSNALLIPGVDWQPGHLFDSASHETEWIQGGIYGSILIMNRNLTGQFRLEQYQTLGGEWVLSNDVLLEILANRLVDPRTVTYEQVSGIPHIFPPIDHDHPIEDFTGFAEAIISIDSVRMAIEARTQIWQENPPILMSQYYMKEETETIIANLIDEKFDELTDDRFQQLFDQLNALTQQVNVGLDERYTKTQSDNRYYLKSETYSKTEVDAMFNNLVQDSYTKAESDSRYPAFSSIYTRVQSDSRYMNINKLANETEVGGMKALLVGDVLHMSLDGSDIVITP